MIIVRAVDSCSELALLLNNEDPDSSPVPGRGGNVGVDVFVFSLGRTGLGDGTAESSVETDVLRELWALMAFAGCTESISIAEGGVLCTGGVGGLIIAVGSADMMRGESAFVDDLDDCDTKTFC